MKQTISILSMLFEFLCSQELRIWLRMAVKPLAVMVTLAIMLWLGAWCDAQLNRQIAQAETQDLACPAGTEQNGALCYPLCQDGYYGVGPVCYQDCPPGFESDSSFCFKAAHIFAKASYGRGGGVGLVCATNQEAQGGLCYPKCASGYYGVGPVCWQHCRAGYADHGATCFKHIFDFYGKPTYGRGAGGPVSVCAPGLERNGALCYPRCAAGFYGAGPVCFQRCPVGYKDDGATCRKDAIVFATPSFGRGAGTVMNSLPVAIDETARTPKDTPIKLTFKVDNFDNDELSNVIFVQKPSHGEVDAGIYTPNPGFEGSDTITWKTNDGKHDSNVAIATVLVDNVDPNAAPVALDRTVSVTEDTPISITVTCTDVDNDELFYQLLAKPQHGDYQWLPPNTVIYTPTVDFVGTDSFTFRSYDGQDVSNISIITLTVAALNDAPVALAQTISTTRNSNVAINLFASDVESDTISYTLVSSPTHGLLSGEIPTLLYTPAHNFVGVDSFQFQASDGPSDVQSAATVATISLTVQPTNTAPLAESLILTTSEESAVALNLAGSDAEGDVLAYTFVTSPTHGLLTGEGTDWVYTPQAGFIGADSWTFKTSDGQADSDAANITINVLAAPAAASVVGIVYADSNGNGQPDESDSGVSGLLVTLTSKVQAAGLTTTFTTQTDVIGAWRLDEVPLGEYTLRIASSAGVQVETPVLTQLTVGTRGVQQLPPAQVKVVNLALFLPLVQR